MVTLSLALVSATALAHPQCEARIDGSTLVLTAGKADCLRTLAPVIKERVVTMESQPRALGRKASAGNGMSQSALKLRRLAELNAAEGRAAQPPAVVAVHQ